MLIILNYTTLAHKPVCKKHLLAFTGNFSYHCNGCGKKIGKNIESLRNEGKIFCRKSCSHEFECADCNVVTVNNDSKLKAMMPEQSCWFLANLFLVIFLGRMLVIM